MLLSAYGFDGDFEDVERGGSRSHDEQDVSAMPASSLASGISVTGGVSMITQSNLPRASAISCFMRGDVRLAIGS